MVFGTLIEFALSNSLVRRAQQISDQAKAEMEEAQKDESAMSSTVTKLMCEKQGDARKRYEPISKVKYMF